MKITHLRTNHMKNPLGYSMKYPIVSWKVVGAKGTKTEEAIVNIAKDIEMKQIVAEFSGENVNSFGTELPITLEASTRYYWNVEVITDVKEDAISEVAWFETPKQDEEWVAEWITSEHEDGRVVFHSFGIENEVQKARLSMSAVGMYEVYIDGEKIGDEYLSPNFNDYDSWIPWVYRNG